MGAFRGAGRPEAAAMLERIIDIAAVELGIDPAEIRRRNFLQPDEFPYTTVMRTEYDSGDYDTALTEALRVAGYDELRREQAERRARGDRVVLGIGVSAYVEITAGGGGAEYGSVTVNADGTATIRVGTSAHGQGHATSFAMIVADRLQIPLERVHFVQSDTAEVPTGGGTGGSRSLQLGGSAVLNAADAVVAQAREVAATMLEANPDDIVVMDGGVGVAGVPASVLTWAQLAETDAHRRGLRLPPGRRDVPVRRARRGRGSRSRHRPGHADPPRRGRRLRAHPQPADRRRPTARRDRAGHRAGAVGAVRLRRRRQPAHLDAHRLRDAERGGAAVVRGVEHRDAFAAERARRQGHRRVGNDRIDARGAERGDRRAAVTSGCGTSTSRAPPQRVWAAVRDAEAGIVSSPWREPPAVFDNLTAPKTRADADAIDI